MGSPLSDFVTSLNIHVRVHGFDALVCKNKRENKSTAGILSGTEEKQNVNR